jgi:hypothetical protein
MASIKPGGDTTRSGSGVLMAAFGPAPYSAQAVLAAASIKQFHPEIQIAIATDQSGHPLLQSSLFDLRIAIDLSGAPRLRHCSAALPHSDCPHLIRPWPSTWTPAYERRV